MTKKNEVKRKATDYTFDRHNANKGTERGQKIVSDSIAKNGAGRSIVTDKHGEVIAGNKTLEAAITAGLQIIEIETDGSELVVVRRRDLDLSDRNGDNPAIRLAIADNRASELGLKWDAETLASDLANGVDLSGMFLDWEIDKLMGRAVEPIPAEVWKDMPEFEQPDTRAFRTIKVHFHTQEAVEEFARLVGQKLTDKTRSINFPEIPTENLKALRYES